MPGASAAARPREVRAAARWDAGLGALGTWWDRPLPAASRPVHRLRLLAASLLLTASAFSSSPGLISGDTKLDLTADPWGWLAGGLKVWSPDALGSLQNQAYGYLFPMGPFHLLGLSAGLPVWVVQRLWWSVLLVAAFLGVVRLAGRLGVGTPGGRILAGLLYALSPRVLTELGGLSSEVLPLAALPWVLVPLVGTGALERSRRAAARSGVAVLLAGAVNAAATLAVLPLAALWLLPGLRTAAGRRLATWWALAVTLACAWWVVPLLVQGAYSPPFLDYIETAEITTLTTSLVEVLRGTSHWLGYLADDGGPWWRSGWTLVTSPAVIVDTAVVAALGLVGLAGRGMPGRRRLGAAALLGLALVSVGHAGDLASPLAGSVRDLLDGPLAPFRNVHKFDPLLRLPLALGVAHALTLLPVPRARRALAVVAGIALLGVSTPVLAGQLAPDGAYRAVPEHWQEAADWIDAHAGDSSTLLAPAAGHAEHVWGRPMDNPLQALASSPVVVRDAVPLGGPEVTRLLDAVGVRLDTGRGSAGLAPALARAGIGHVVVRNDLDRQRSGAPRPALVARALADSPGIERVALFGPPLGNPGIRDGLVSDRGLDRLRPAVEIYAVEGAGPPVTALPRAGAWVVAGGPEATLALADRGLLTGRATLPAGSDVDAPDARPVVTDSFRRKAVDVGRARDNASVTLTADEPADASRLAAGSLPGVGSEAVTVARWIGVEAVTASSSAADVDAVLARGQDRAPYAAVDGDVTTAWLSGSDDPPVGQWLEVELEQPRDLSGARLAVADRTTDELVSAATQVEVRTDTGTATTSLRPGGVLQELVVPPGETSSLRVTVRAVEERELAPLVGIRELVLPQVFPARTAVVPPVPEAEGAPLLLLDAPPGGRDGCVRTSAAPSAGLRCTPELSRGGEESGGLDRTFTLPAPASLPVAGLARPRPGPALDALLDAGAPLRVTASSRAVPDPAGRPATLVDGDPSTGWVAGESDETPELTLSWDGARVVDGVRLLREPGFAAADATRVEVTSAAGTVVQDVPRDGRIPLPPAAVDRLTVRVLESEELVDVAPGGRLSRVPAGFTEVEVGGLDDLVAPAPPPTEPVEVACGEGPPVVADGGVVPTSVAGTRADLLALRPVPLVPCPAGAAFALSAGEHRVVGGRTDLLEVVSLTLGDTAVPPAGRPRAVEVERWDDEQRRVAVGPGDASWLVVHEAANRGWKARLDGRLLEPGRVDGWQQAWELPAGAGGEVELVYAPGGVHRAGLAVGALAAVALVGLALLRGGRRPVTPAAPAGLPRAVRLLVPAALLAVLGGVAGLAAWALALALGRWRPGVLAPLAGGSVVLAGLLVAWQPWPGGRAAFDWPAQALCLLAVAAVAVALSRPRPGASTAAPAAPPAAG